MDDLRRERTPRNRLPGGERSRRRAGGRAGGVHRLALPSCQRGKRIHDLHDKKLDEMRQAFEQALPLPKSKSKSKPKKKR